MTTRRFVVTGCGRSGTGYTSALLNRLGIRCGHEDVFHPFTEAATFGDYQGDASWLAVPWLERLPTGTVVLHQVRNPLDVARSHLGIGFFHDDRYDAHAAYVDVVRQIVAVDREPTPLGRFLRYWVDWNRLVETSANTFEYVRYRVESIDEELLARLLDRIGIDAAPGAARQALALTDRRTNRRAHDPCRLDETFPASALARRFLSLAEHYGYRVSGRVAARVAG